LVAGHTSLEVVATTLLAVRAVLLCEFKALEKRVRSIARSDARALLLTSVPGVGAIVALTVAAAIDDPVWFKSSKSVGAHFGMTPKKYQSGETDVIGRISKIGDGSVRTAAYEAAHIILTKPLKGCARLKSWGMTLAKRAGMKKAKGALARKLTVIMHRMLTDGTTFRSA
jgi:transposase